MPFVLETYLADRKRAVEEHLFASLPAAEAVGGSAEDARYAATAVELLHTYTLVHDDLPCMDNDLLRRGQPTVHARYGEAIAVLTGDALQTLAFEMLANTPERRPGTVARLVKELAAAVGFAGVIGGQVEDIRFAAAPTRDVIDFVFQHKTADLFKAACRLGALAAGGDEDAVDKLSRFADALGFAFQIIDDLLDAPSASADAAPELSCLAVMSADEARDWARKLTAQAVAALDGLPGETAPLAALANHLLTRII